MDIGFQLIWVDVSFSEDQQTASLSCCPSLHSSPPPLPSPAFGGVRDRRGFSRCDRCRRCLGLICNPLMSYDVEHLFMCFLASASLLWGGIWMFCRLSFIFLVPSFRVAHLFWIAVLYQLCLLQVSSPCLWHVFSLILSTVSGTEQESPADQFCLSWTVFSVASKSHHHT